MAAKARKIQKSGYMQRERISELPREILSDILSLIPIKDLVRTSILSKRWKSVWTSVGVIEIRDSDFFRPSSLYPNMYHKMKETSFVNFTERVLNQVEPLRKLELNCTLVYSKQWIDNVTNKLYAHAASLHDLDLSLTGFARNNGGLVKLHPSIFTSKTLVTLKLDFNVEQLKLLPSSSSSVLKVFWLPSLKVLHLRRDMDLSAVESILTGCPVLEELFLRGTLYNELNKERLCVKSSTLKRLTSGFRFRIKLRIEIDASNLEELDLRIVPLDQIVVMNTSLPLLTRLVLDIALYTTLRKPDILVYGSGFIQLLTKAPNTKYLFLSSRATMCLQYGGYYQQLPMFMNLADLNLVVHSDNWSILTWFLKSAPNLVSLSIRHDNFLEPQGTPNCSKVTRLHHLEKVELKDFEDHNQEMKLVRYLLNKVPVLKTMNVNWHHGLTTFKP